jgi:Tol biopolymer transport system component
LSCSTGRSVALGTAGVGEGFALHGDKTHVTNTDNVDEFQPSYSPDGKKIAYAGYKGNDADLYTIDVGGGGKTSLTNTDNVDEYMPSWGSRP